MIPISDRIFIFTNRKPFIVYGLIVTNIALFLWELKLELSGELGNFISSWGVVPAQVNGSIANGLSGNLAAWIALLIGLTSLPVGMFLHGSFSQITGNLLFLWVFGRNLENILGHGRFLGLYLGSGLLTVLAQIMAEPSLAVPLIGANGAIASILGAYILKFPKAKIDTVIPLVVLFIPTQLPAFSYLLWWFVQQIFFGIGSLDIPGGVNPNSIGYWTHGVGLAIGASVSRLLLRR